MLDLQVVLLANHRCTVVAAVVADAVDVADVVAVVGVVVAVAVAVPLVPARRKDEWLDRHVETKEQKK